MAEEPGGLRLPVPRLLRVAAEPLRRLEVWAMTDAQKLVRILQALDDRARGLLDAEGLVDTLLAILAGRDPYASWERLAS